MNFLGSANPLKHGTLRRKDHDMGVMTRNKMQVAYSSDDDDEDVSGLADQDCEMDDGTHQIRGSKVLQSAP